MRVASALGWLAHQGRRTVGYVRKRAVRGRKAAQYLRGRSKDAGTSLHFRLRESKMGAAALQTAYFVRRAGEIRDRRRAFKQYAEGLRAPVIDAVAGYGLFSLAGTEHFAAGLDACRRLFEAKTADDRLAGLDALDPSKQRKFLTQKRSFLRYLLDDHDLRQHPALVDLALSDALLGSASRYLGMVPLLSRIDLMYSLPREGDDHISSQLFHLDYEGLTQVKCFIHVFDVGEDEGPFTFIPADASSRALRDIRKLRQARGARHDVKARRYLDEEIGAVRGNDSIVRVMGPTGTCAAVDTSRCLHLGSRVQAGTFRLCLYIQYCATRELTNVFDVERYRHDPVRYLAVKHSVEPGRARATDYTHQIMAG
jgi:hypothetical protein